MNPTDPNDAQQIVIEYARVLEQVKRKRGLG